MALEDILIWAGIAIFCLVLIIISLIVSVSAWSVRAGAWVQGKKYDKK